jgi:hypothetical protein
VKTSWTASAISLHQGKKMITTARAAIGACLVAFAALLFTGTAAQAQTPPCPPNMRAYSTLAFGQPFKCTCAPGQMRGSVWGTGRYTADSSICRAAVHSGAVPPSGGEVTVYRAPGCPAFAGTTANGVRTGKWGPYSSTYTFTWPAPSCSLQQAADNVRACPRTMVQYRGMPPGQRLTCSCKPAQYGGSVWGGPRYTADSSTCGAALHAGAIPAGGGTVTVRTFGGCSRFQGSSSNGITSRGWGSYNRTFAFSSVPPACSN